MSRLGAEEGDLLIAYKSVKRTVSLSNLSITGGSGNRVLSFDEGWQQLGGKGQFVYFSKLQGALSIGSTVAVLQEARATSLISDAEIPDYKDVVAHVQIIDATSEVYIGYIVMSKQEVRLLDVVGG